MGLIFVTIFVDVPRRSKRSAKAGLYPRHCLPASGGILVLILIDDHDADWDDNDRDEDRDEDLEQRRWRRRSRQRRAGSDNDRSPNQTNAAYAEYRAADLHGVGQRAL